MAFQGEREPGVLEMDVELVESMAQDGIPEQDMLNVQEQFPPQTNPEPEMGAAATALDPPPPLRQNPSPAPDGSTPDNGELTAAGFADMRGMFDALMGAMRVNAQQMGNEMRVMNEKMENNINEKMEANTKKMEANMRGEMKAMRSEMRRVGQCLQAGKRATPSAATNELRGSAPAGTDREIRETCWASIQKYRG